MDRVNKPTSNVRGGLEGQRSVDPIHPQRSKGHDALVLNGFRWFKRGSLHNPSPQWHQKMVRPRRVTRRCFRFSIVEAEGFPAEPGPGLAGIEETKRTKPDLTGCHSCPAQWLVTPIIVENEMLAARAVGEAAQAVAISRKKAWSGLSCPRKWGRLTKAALIQHRSCPAQLKLS